MGREAGSRKEAEVGRGAARGSQGQGACRAPGGLRACVRELDRRHLEAAPWRLPTHSVASGKGHRKPRKKQGRAPMSNRPGPSSEDPER